MFTRRMMFLTKSKVRQILYHTTSLTNKNVTSEKILPFVVFFWILLPPKMTLKDNLVGIMAQVSPSTSTFLKTLNKGAKVYCTHCRLDLSEENTRPLKCSRCQVFHYCSKDCQKANFKLHKALCKRIHSCREKANVSEDEEKNSRHKNQYDLANSIVKLCYLSTDTIDRGMTSYNTALVEYCRLLRQDFFYPGAYSSTMILLAILGHDDYCKALHKFLLAWSEEEVRDGRYATTTASYYEWNFGTFDSNVSRFNSRFKEENIVALVKPMSILVPLLLVETRRQAKSSSKPFEAIHYARRIGDFAGYQAPVFRSLFPYSRESFKQEEVDRMFGEGFECFPTFWMMIQDCYAFNPELLDALESTRQYVILVEKDRFKDLSRDERYQREQAFYHYIGVEGEGDPH